VVTCPSVRHVLSVYQDECAHTTERTASIAPAAAQRGAGVATKTPRLRTGLLPYVPLRLEGIRHIPPILTFPRKLPCRRRKVSRSGQELVVNSTLRCPYVFQTRDDRELVRARLNLREKATRVKAQIQMLLKRHRDVRASETLRRWSKAYRSWLKGLIRPTSPLPEGTRAMLGSLLRQLAFLEEEIDCADDAVFRLAAQPRYARAVRALCRIKGVHILTAMVFLSELGDLSRFANRRQVAAYLGLAPSSHESGQEHERKGHITHQGPARVRKVLCQAVWSSLGCDASAQARHARITAGKQQRRKIATVALMRQLAIRMWHLGLVAQREAGCFVPPTDSEAA